MKLLQTYRSTQRKIIKRKVKINIKILEESSDVAVSKTESVFETGQEFADTPTEVKDNPNLLKKLDSLTEKAEDFVGRSLLEIGSGIKSQLTDESGIVYKIDSTLEKAENFVGNRILDIGSGISSILVADEQKANERTSKLETVGLYLNHLDKLAEKAEDSVFAGVYSLGSRLSLLGKPKEPEESNMIIYDRKTLDLIQLSKDPQTFLQDPLISDSGSASPSHIKTNYENFMKSYDPIGNAGKVASILISDKDISNFYKNLGKWASY